MTGKCDKAGDVLAASTAATLVYTARGVEVFYPHTRMHTIGLPATMHLNLVRRFSLSADNGEREVFFGYWDVPGLARLFELLRPLC